MIRCSCSRGLEESPWVPKASFPRVPASDLTHSSIAPADSDPLSPAKHFHLPLMPNLKREMQHGQARGLRTRQGMTSPSLLNRNLLEHHLPECNISSDASNALPTPIEAFCLLLQHLLPTLLHRISTPPSRTHSPTLNHTSFANHIVTSPYLKPNSAPPTPSTRPDQPSLHYHGLRRIARSDGARSFPRVTDRYSPATILKRALPCKVSRAKLRGEEVHSHGVGWAGSLDRSSGKPVRRLTYWRLPASGASGA